MRSNVAANTYIQSTEDSNIAVSVCMCACAISFVFKHAYRCMYVAAVWFQLTYMHLRSVKIAQYFVHMARLHTLANFEKDRLLDKLNNQGYLEIEGSVSVDMSPLIQQHKMSQARQLKVGTSLPSLPVKMPQADAARRLACLRESPKASVNLLEFEVEATALQNWVQQAKLKPVKNLVGVWFGWISIDPARVSVLEVSPFGPKPLIRTYVCMYIYT